MSHPYEQTGQREVENSVDEGQNLTWPVALSPALPPLLQFNTVLTELLNFGKNPNLVSDSL